MRKSYTFHYQHPYIKNIDKNGGFPCTKLIDAVKKDELDNVQTLLALGVDPNFVTNDNGWLIETVDSVEMAKLLVNYGVKINHEVGFEIPYFIGICQQEKLDLLRYLISIGMDVTVKNLNGENVLCFFGIENTEILKTLIDAGIDLDAGEAGIADGAIHVFNTNIDCLELLIENNIDIHKLGYNERSALYGSDYKVANLLISLGLEVNVQDEDGDSPLRHAFDIHSAEVLILNGADLDSDDLKKGAPYDNWVEEYSKIMALVEYYTPLVGHLRNNKTTKLHCVQSVKVAELLLIDNSIEINALNLYNQTPLMAAISRGNYDIAMLLIEKGGKIYTGTSNRYSPIYLYPDQKFTNFYLEQSSRFFTKNSIEGLPKLANKIINQIQMGENIEVSSEAEEYVLTVNRNDWKLPLYFNLRNSESAVLNMNFQSIADCDANTKNKIVKEVKDEFKRRVKKNGSLDGNHGQILIDSNFSISYQAEFVKMNLLINHQSFESFIKYAIDTILDFIEIIQNSKQSISRPIIPTTVQTKEVSIYQKVDNMLKQYTYEYWSSSDSFGIKIPIKAKSYLKVDVLIYSDNHIGFTSSPYLLKRIDEYDFKRIKKWLVEKGVMFKNQYGIDLELDGLTVSQKLYYYFSELNENSFLNSLAQFIECSLYVNNYLYRYMKSYYEVESETGGGFNNWFWHNK
jgi:ankyrin repeat protein